MRVHSRRSLLAALSACSVGMLVPFGSVQFLAVGRSLAERITCLFGDRVPARAIGNAYLKSRPGSFVIADLAGVLVGNVDRHEQSMWTGDRSLRRFLHVQRQRDFECGRTVCIGGWVLCETEANLCAIVALLPSSRSGDVTARPHV